MTLRLVGKDAELFPFQLEELRQPIDSAAARTAVGDLLEALGYDWRNDQHLMETPRRVADALGELLAPACLNLTTFPNDGYGELVVVKDIEFHSLCAHHLLPFAGVAHIGYLPGERIIGLTKLARVVEFFCRGLQVQERLTTQVARWVADNLHPRGVGIVMEAEHSCMSIRGVKKSGSRIVTSTLLGEVRDDPRVGQEFLSLIGLSGGG